MQVGIRTLKRSNWFYQPKMRGQTSFFGCEIEQWLTPFDVALKVMTTLAHDPVLPQSASRGGEYAEIAGRPNENANE